MPIRIRLSIFDANPYPIPMVKLGVGKTDFFYFDLHQWQFTLFFFFVSVIGVKIFNFLTVY
jgi:hypothetical protein